MGALNVVDEALFVSAGPLAQGALKLLGEGVEHSVLLQKLYSITWNKKKVNLK